MTFHICGTSYEVEYCLIRVCLLSFVIIKLAYVQACGAALEAKNFSRFGNTWLDGTAKKFITVIVDQN